MKTYYALITLLILVLFTINKLVAQEEVTEGLGVDEILCPSSNLIGTAMITDVCWEGVFPLQIGGVTLYGKTRYAPADRSNDRGCFCGSRMFILFNCNSRTSTGVAFYVSIVVFIFVCLFVCIFSTIFISFMVLSVFHF